VKKILIINLRRIGDIYTTGHLVNSIVNSVESAVSLLVYNENEKAAVNLKNITNIYYVDRKEIITLKTNQLFSDGFALEQLFNQLQAVKNQKWDEIVNYSNDLIGAYICSYLKGSTQKMTGVHFNESRNIITNSNWDILFNDVLPVVKFAPMHFVDCYHKMMGIKSNREGEKLITNATHNSTAFNNINTIRKNLAASGHVSKIIGIQLKTSELSKDLPEKTIIELIKLINNNSELIPIILIAPTDEERKYANEINLQFNNDIVIVEADLLAVTSVLLNIDLLITPDTAIKHIADLTETPVLEISLGHAPFLKQGSYSAGSLILTDLIIDRNFNTHLKNETKSNIQAQDIISSLMYFFAKTKSIRPRLSNDVTLYSCSFDQLGARYSVVAGTVDSLTEIHRLMSRQLINFIYDQNESDDIYNDVIDFGISTATNWSQSEKASVTLVMKDLLGTLRSLLQSLENRKSSRDFINNLSKLMSHAESNTLVQIPVTMFKTKIESINARSFEENAKEVEGLLYELKSDIQKILHCIKKLEDCISIQKKEEFMHRTSEVNSNSI
jgi:ADP-heptose:LPS heptosyltransferase